MLRYSARRLLVALALSTLASLSLARPASAQTEGKCVEYGDKTVESGETLDCDLFVIGGNLYVDEGATILGSANVVGSARIAGLVTGDLSVLRDLELSGRVERNATAITGYALLDGSVGGNLAAGGYIEIRGQVGGDVSADGDLLLEDDARVEGSLEVVGAIDRADGAEVVGGSRDEAGSAWLPRLGWALAMVLFSTLFAALIMGLAPDALANIRNASERSPVMLSFLGMLALLILPFVGILILPIPIYLFALILGTVGYGERLGNRYLSGRSRRTQASFGTGVLALLWALVFLLGGSGGLGRFCLAGLLVVALAGLPLGAGLITLLGRRQWPSPADSGSWPAETGRSAGPPSGEPGDASAVIGSPLNLDPPEPVDPVEATDPASDAPESGAPEFGGPPTAEIGEDQLPATDLEAPDAFAPPAFGEAESAAPPAADLDPVGAPDALDDAPNPEPSRLRQVAGVSPIYAEIMAEAGLLEIEDLATADPARVAEIASAPGVMPIDLDTAAAWVRSARELMQGG